MHLNTFKRPLKASQILSLGVPSCQKKSGRWVALLNLPTYVRKAARLCTKQSEGYNPLRIKNNSCVSFKPSLHIFIDFLSHATSLNVQ